VTLPLVLGREADAEIAEAARWYESRRAGLGEDLLDEVQRMLAMLQMYPELGAIFDEDKRLRQIPVQRFPFHVVYLLDASALVVVAFAHFSRRRGYWRDRI
jgi:toxin ParE1/3/4